ncbi:hypothetical protein [Magnetococcus sp. PR-3]|uniref:hypothetical protein n=1 Tax=Magnetococcus sp. PR-3 TaxID=3120355 RepID=UPI002FCE044A
MPLPPKQFYTIKEVAERWRCSENDLLSYGMEGKLELSIWVPHCHVELSCIEEDSDGQHYNIPFETRYMHGLLPLSEKDIGTLWSYGQVDVTYLKDTEDGHQRLIRHYSMPGLEYQCDDAIEVVMDMLKLSGDEIRQFEKKHLNQSVSQSPVEAANEEPLSLRERHHERTVAIAQYLLSLDPYTPATKLFSSEAITKIACEGKPYSERTYRRWLKPIMPERKRGRPKS